ncbi:MAG: Rv2993c-like domain-containing protein, partial [Solirubrobacteraceae bacterium]
MKLATFRISDRDGPLAGVVRDDRGHAPTDGVTVLDVLAGDAKPEVTDRGWALAEVTLLTPVPGDLILTGTPSG